jgi:hypothetical protein
MEALAQKAGYKTEIQALVFSVSDFQIWVGERKRVGKKSDFTIFSMSSHGTQWSSDAPGEGGYEEGLCFWNGQDIEVLPDVDFIRLLHQIPGSVFVVLDSCFSGGMSRARKVAESEGAWKSRFISFNPSFQVFRPFKGRAVHQRAQVPENKLYFIAASSEDEVSWSTGTGGLFTKSFTGAYERYATKSMRTIKRLMAIACEECSPEQTPVFKGYGGTQLKTIF